jgi:hypothetical protein
MTDDQKRIAIAEEDGWTHIPGEAPRYGGTFTHAGWKSFDGEFHRSDWRKKSAVGLPPYLTSRDAIVPAILRRFRTDHEKHKFNMALRDALDNWGGIEVSVAFALATADPRVLADAYLAAATKP